MMSDVGHEEKAGEWSGMVAVDFDNTIVDTAGAVAKRTSAALAHATARNWAVVGATGRPASICAPVLQQVPAMQYLVASNGAEVWRVGDTTPLIAHELSVDTAQRVVAAIRQAWPKARFCLTCGDGTQRWEPGFTEIVTVAPVGEPVRDAGEAMGDPIRSIVVFGEPIERLGSDATETLDEIVLGVDPSVAAAPSGLGLPELRPRAISKASALEDLCRRLGVDRLNTVAFGDGSNDHDMLRWAHRGVAMASADQRTRELADEVTASIEDDGVALWLERYLLSA